MAPSKSLTKIQIQGKTRRIPEIYFFPFSTTSSIVCGFFCLNYSLSVVCDNSNQSTIQILVTNSSVSPFSKASEPNEEPAPRDSQRDF